MSDMTQRPPAPGWYSVAADEIVYFDGAQWTARRRLAADGTWQDVATSPPPAPSAASFQPPAQAQSSGQFTAPLQPTGTPIPGSAPSSPGAVPQGPADAQYEPQGQGSGETGSGGPWGAPASFGAPQAAPGADQPYGPPGAGAQPPWGVPGAGWGQPGYGNGAAGAPPYGAAGGGYGGYGQPGFGSQGAGQPKPDGTLDLYLGEPAAQSRLTVAFRGLLIIPNAIVLGLLFYVFEVVSIVLWLSALVAARAPIGLWRFGYSLIQWQARLSAYTYFLTDRYPPFTLGEAPYPVTAALAGPPSPYRRGAVLLRIFFAIPAAVVAALLEYGASVLAFVTWLVTLVKGTTPRTLHVTLAAVVRYRLRYVSYLYLLTTTYPSAPLGDATAPGGLDQGVIAVPRSGKIALVTSGVAAILLAIVANVALGVGAAHAAGHLQFTPGASAPGFTSSTPVSQWNQVAAKMKSDEGALAAELASCGGATTLNCFHQALRQDARAVDMFTNQIGSINFPTAQEHAQAVQLVSSMRQLASLDRRASSAPEATMGAYRQRITQAGAPITALVAAISQELGPSASKP